MGGSESLYDLESPGSSERKTQILRLNEQIETDLIELASLHRQLSQLQATATLPVEASNEDKLFPGEKELRRQIVELDRKIQRARSDIGYLRKENRDEENTVSFEKPLNP